MKKNNPITIPAKYQIIFDKLMAKQNYFYLDTLAFLIAWRNENKLQIPVGEEYLFSGTSKEGIFIKMIVTLVENLFAENENYPFDSDARRLGHDFAKWILRQPLNFRPPISMHAEIASLWKN
ncbi:MAG: hypothetical protein KatS3mg101_0999 [Patescibacteria group bacterium]|nr:MAG: hypothetical protein KatS3mg101_0999 [Patescibacteria group bacterium]